MKHEITQSEATRAFAKIGFLSFGGPAAQISVMHRILVDEKKWLTESQFLHALNFCMLLPGPEAMQLSTYAGWLLHGIRGGLIAGLLFILPGLVMMLALSAIYVSFGDVPLIAGLFYGLKAAVLAIVAQAILKLSKKALGNGTMVIVAVLAFFGIAFLNVPFPLIVMGAGFLGALIWWVKPNLLPLKVDGVAAVETSSKRQQFGMLFKTVFIWGSIWFIPLVALTMLLGPENIFARMGVFFSQVAAVTFGGAYAVLAYVAQHAVDGQGWLSADDMLTGLGLAETTLGPLVLVLVFVGFMSGATAGGGVSLISGLVGGLVAAFFTFVPCFLWIFAGAPYVERLRHIRWLQASLATVTASVVGVIANLALWLGLAVIFGAIASLNVGPLTLPVPDLMKIDWLAVAIILASGFALLKFKVNMMVVLMTAAFVGAAKSLI